LSESRKLAAIFAADVVGFSRLAGAGVSAESGLGTFRD
jgi:NAD-dependent SIR2 family protein deacetylase